MSERESPGFSFKIARLRAGRTQRSLAFELRIAASAISEFECGWRTFPPELVARLYAALRPDETRGTYRPGEARP